MKITQDEVVDNQTTLHIELEDADLDPYLDRAYRQVADRVVIPGFRKGKAPRRVVEGVIGRESLLNEVLDNMVYESADKAIQAQDLESVGVPKIADLDLDPVQFSATVALQPEVRLGDYRSIRIDFEMDEITEEQVSNRLDSILQSLGSWETAERAPQIGDMITMDMLGEIEGNTRWELNDSPFYLDEDDEIPLPGFGDSLAGAKTDEQIEFTLDVPDDYADDNIAGKEARFTVTVKDVRERVLPELNDEFARSLPDGFEDLAALKTAIEDSLRADVESRVNEDYQGKVVEALLKEAVIDIAPVLLEREADRIENDQYSFLERSNIRRDDFLSSIGKTEEQLREEAEEEAVMRVRRQFAIDRVMELETIEAADSEIDERFSQVFAGQTMRRRERRERRESVERMLKYEKTLSLLVSIAKGERDGQDAGESDPPSEDE